MKELQMTHKTGDQIKWVLSADKADLPIGNKEVYLTSLHLRINQKPEIYLSSGSGIYDIDDKNVSLNDSVELKIEDAKFTTDKVIWNSKEDLITTDDEIKFSGNNFLIEGTGLIAKTEQQWIRITKNVKAVFYR